MILKKQFNRYVKVMNRRLRLLCRLDYNQLQPAACHVTSTTQHAILVAPPHERLGYQQDY
jgi:hypothetical protein